MNRQSRAINTSRSDQIFDIVNCSFMTLAFVITLYPFLNVLAISLNDSMDTVKGGIYLWPRKWTWANYDAIFSFKGLITGFKISLLRTFVGTLLGLLSSSMLAFVLSRSDFQARKLVSTFLVMTMYVSGGLIPGFILIRHLGMMNSFWVYVLPGMVSAWNVFIIRSFIDGLPSALQESAKLDGANDFTIYWRVILPLCKPVLATVALFLAVGQWNSWFDTFLYNSTARHLTTLQYELMKVLQSTQIGSNDIHDPNMSQLMNRISPESVKMAITIVVTVPILIVYPFLQRYFVKGMTLGAVKS
ncbi:carbohydrate ABC transporter permease [Paenibacillus sp. FSL E2-8871]|uniref:carbohydrate ABC transporter permease n=1 Tax=Paenibacillus sp. FSL E2-8871 TaxID=2975326 RepID=UPI0030FA09F9